MSYLDTGYGLCGCGIERRLYHPFDEELGILTGPGPDKCSVCTVGGHREQLPPDAPKAPPVFGKRYLMVKARRERLLAAGLCIDCGKIPPLVGNKRCNRCYEASKNSKRVARVRRNEAA